jgi:shikimate dehydrogenase
LAERIAMPLSLPNRDDSADPAARPTVRQALEAMRRDADGAILAGLIGRGIRESRTPGMHEAEGARLGLRYRYRLLDFDQLHLDDAALGELVSAAGESGFAGLNVTHPFKESVVVGMDRLSPEAEAIGAVNTVVLREGARVGHNTDSWGFSESFRRGMGGASLDSVLLIGAGGAGRAVAHALLGLGTARLTIFDIVPAKAAALARRLAPAFGSDRLAATGNLEVAAREAQGVVNASPVGMAKYPGSPLSAAWLRPGLWVADIVYFPADTALLRAARASGCRTLPGIGMAIFQAVKAFELITGVAPDATAMARHFDSV